MSIKYDTILGQLREQDSSTGLSFTPDFIYSVQDYGATGDGSTDDSAAIQSAINAASSAGGGTVYLPKGNYKLVSSLVPKSNVSIIGAGIDQAILLPYGIAAAIRDTTSGSSVSPLTNMSFSDFTIDGANHIGTYNVGMKGFYIQYLRLCKFRRLYIKNTGATGLGCDFYADCLVEDVIADGCGRLGNSASAGAAGIGVGVKSALGGSTSFVNCITRNNATYGIFFESQDSTWSKGYSVINHFSEGNGSSGIGDAGCDGLKIVGGVSRNNGSHGFSVDHGTVGTSAVGKNGLVSNLEVYGNIKNGVILYQGGNGYTLRGINAYSNESGIRIWPSESSGSNLTKITIDNCNIYGNSIVSLKLGQFATGSGLTDCVVTNNRLYNNGQHGIDISSSMLNGKISCNRIFDDRETQVQTYAIVLYTSNNISGNFVIENNDLRTNKTGSMLLNGTVASSVVIRDNPGYNPIGQSTITVGASPFTYTAGNSPENVYINGGTVSNITKGGTSIFTASPATVRLEQGQSVTIAYSVAPTMIKEGA